MEKLIKSMKQDPELQVSDDQVNEWIDEIVEKGYHYLENMTYDTIEKDKQMALQDYPVELREEWLNSLKQYRVVYSIQDIVLGNFTRWLVWSKNNQQTEPTLLCGDTLHHGGVLTHIRFSDINVFCHIMFNYRRNIRAMITFNDTILFQKISNEEHMVLLANANRDNND
jgi:hypothetical protein